MVVRKVNGKEPDSHKNVDVGTVTSVNGITPDENGNLTIPFSLMPGEARSVKMWTGTAITNADGLWNVDYSSAGFTQVKTIQVTVENANASAADRPAGAYVVSKSNTSANGRSYKITSAGLLAAMTLLNLDQGSTIHVLVIGH